MKKILTIILFCILTIGMASIASAAEWRYVAPDMDNNQFFFDIQSFEKVSDTIYTVWIKQEYSEANKKEMSEGSPDYYGYPVTYSLYQYVFDFHNKKARVAAFENYDKDNNIVHANKLNTQWDNITPNNLGSDIFTATYDYYKKHY